MRVSDLLAEDSLQLRLHTPSTAKSLATSISYSAPAEFLDPTPFLGANCLLITHGIGFNFFDQRTWDAYVERLAGVPVCAIAFVTGVAHRLIPKPLVEAAKAHQIPLLEVPSVVPALQLQRFVTSVLEAERFALTRQSWELADRCAKAARSGGSLRAVLAQVGAAADGQCAVFDTTGALVSCWPAGSRWTAEDLRQDGRGAPGSSFALPTGGTDHFQLVVRGGTTGEPLATLIGPASSILAMQLNSAFKAGAPHQGKLERLMLQLEDWQGVALKELTRTFRATGLDAHAPTFLLAAEPDRTQLPNAWRIRLAVQDHLNNAHVFTYRGSIYALAQARTDTAADWQVIPDRLLASLRQIVPGLPLVIKGPLRSVDELRLGLAHAQRLVRQVSEPTIAAPMSIESLVVATAGSGAHAAAENLLAPLLEYDRANNGRLLPTLRAYLDHDAQPSRVCQALYIHRNTLSKRLALMSRLLNVRLDTLEGLTTCMLAVRITDAAP
ncbi:helix-turn-helix domain-containing protein [Arthrobacter sp. 131MFCol6.1]|uniref:helix-turn-helix domain-containing protein n=1 Tax=Arthrobacter sp. 131MFCol6.1 TaxID=1157944 RepID=UPI00039C7D08|nr:PucR family transcriptional regulator [Arthrobacter sp. 131MFCol6.1]